MDDIERDLRRRLKKSIRKRTELNNRVLEYQIQQKEFIEWLENIISNLEKEQSRRFNHTYEYKIDSFKIALSKYREIIGSETNER